MVGSQVEAHSYYKKRFGRKCVILEAILHTRQLDSSALSGLSIIIFGNPGTLFCFA